MRPFIKQELFYIFFSFHFNLQSPFYIIYIPVQHCKFSKVSDFACPGCCFNPVPTIMLGTGGAQYASPERTNRSWLKFSGLNVL